MNKFLYAVLSSTVLLASCSKKPIDYPITDPIILKAITVKDGSYFTFVDSVTGTRDTFISSDYSISAYKNSDNTTTELIGYRMNDRAGNSFHFFADSHDIYGSYAQYSWDNLGTAGYDANSPGYNYSSLIIRNRTYDSVYSHAIEHISFKDTLDLTSYFTLNVGIVKYAYTDVNRNMTVWELDDFRINR